uniref:Uncharacterized protein n=1 Tax=Oryza glaberrima TaxID=4538 RepID=I1QFW2_ORYGL
MASSQSDGSSSYSQHSSRSPIPYRVGPFDYQPAVMSDCRVKAASHGVRTTPAAGTSNVAMPGKVDVVFMLGMMGRRPPLLEKC